MIVDSLLVESSCVFWSETAWSGQSHDCYWGQPEWPH